MRRVYLDHAATTPVDPEVAELMAQVLREVPGNPSSIYAEGRRARANSLATTSTTTPPSLGSRLRSLRSSPART